MTKVIQLPGTRKATPKPKPTNTTKLLFIQKPGHSPAITKSQRTLLTWCQAHEVEMSRAYRAYRAAQPKVETESMEDYEARIVPFPKYEIEPELFAQMKKETRVKTSSIWVCLNTAAFPIAVIVPVGHTPEMDANEIVRDAILDSPEQ